MIRPFTLLCMASAFGAGLYLYQSKHAAQVLDRDIMRVIKQTEMTRERTGMLRAEWALLNEPDRLAELAKAHTSLQTLRPTQFVALADLSTRLPGPVAHQDLLPIQPEPEEPAAVPVAQAAPTPAPVPAAKPRETVAVAAAEPKPKSEIKPAAVVADAKPARAPEKPLARPATQASADIVTPASLARPHPAAEFADAVTPGTVGAAVLRATRSQAAAGYAQVAPSAPAAFASVPTPTATPARTYAQPAYAQPTYGQPAYTRPAYAQPASAQPPAYAQPAYAQPAYAQPAYAPSASLLGGRTALPPPVPFVSR